MIVWRFMHDAFGVPISILKKWKNLKLVDVSSKKALHTDKKEYEKESPERADRPPVRPFPVSFGVGGVTPSLLGWRKV